MTTIRLGPDSYVAGHMHHFRMAVDRRFWWIMLTEELFDRPMAKCVMDDFGDLVRVSEVV